MRQKFYSTKMAGAAAAAFLLTATPFASSICHAMNVQPVVADMSVSGTASKTTIQVANDSTKPLPVELQISKVDLDAKGATQTKPAGEEFLVYPPQAMIPPGGTQVFRVQWMGDADLKKSQSYLFSVNQLPVKTQNASSGMQVVLNFGVVVNVAPVNGQAVLKTIKSEVGRDDKGARRPALIVENPGTKHAYLSDASVTLQSGAWQQTIQSAQLKQLIGLGLVQPGKQRQFMLPIDVPTSVTNISTIIDYKPRLIK